MSQERILVERQDGVVIWRFVNPPEGYMDGASEARLVEVLDAFEQDENARVAVLTGGQDDVFIRHYDVRVLEERCAKMAARGLQFSIERPVPEPLLHQCLRRMEASAKPFIAAMNGTAMGGGFELALACDLRLVQDGPFALGLPEVNLGLMPGAGGTQRLPRLIGVAKALEMCLLGRTLSPQEALVWGLASDCVEGPVLPAALAMAQGLAAQSPKALAHIKQSIRSVQALPPDEGLAQERTRFCDLMVDADALRRVARMNREGLDIRAVS
ncbi:MAG: enoyl-CoA hydratase/isomerase family protein [Pseudomonadota bacterium]